jgi:hypothetical protein
MADSYNGKRSLNQEVKVEDKEESEENEDQKYEADFRAKHNRSMNEKEKE